MANILVFVEQREGVIKKYSLEVLSEGVRLAGKTGGKVAAVIVGSDAAAASLAAYGAGAVFSSSRDELSAYSPEGFAEMVVAAVRSFQPQVLLAAASAMGKDLMPRVAARLDVAAAQDCTGIQCDDTERFQWVRPIFAGKAYAAVSLLGTPQVATLRPNVFQVQKLESMVPCEHIRLDGELKLSGIRARVISTSLVSGQTMELTEAEMIVSGGRGLKGPENYHLVEELAAALGAAVGASRAVVDAGWKEHRFQVGQTGKTVSPTVYIACGISGAIQHLAGMSSSKYIVAINKDPEAPILKVADFGIVGDLFQVLPALTEEIKRFKSAQSA
jgi:electron transfer flavoprotein alpha subunit